MRIVAVGNHKGGVGKTTTAFTLAHVAAAANKRVLLIDCDAQGSLTALCNRQTRDVRGLADVMGAGAVNLCIEAVMVEVAPNLLLASGGARLVAAEMALMVRVRREEVLARALRSLRNVDLVIIDTPQSPCAMGMNALAAAHDVVVPVQPQTLDLHGLGQFADSVREVRDAANARLRIVGVLPTFFGGRMNEHQRSVEEIQKAGLPLLRTRIGRSIRVAEAAKHHVPITVHMPKNAQAVAYQGLAAELGLTD